jgi:hypothetical protein
MSSKWDEITKILKENWVPLPVLDPTKDKEDPMNRAARRAAFADYKYRIKVAAEKMAGPEDLEQEIMNDTRLKGNQRMELFNLMDRKWSEIRDGKGGGE